MPTYCCYWPDRPVTLTIAAPNPASAAALYSEILEMRLEETERVRVCLAPPGRSPDGVTTKETTAPPEVPVSHEHHDLSLFDVSAFIRTRVDAGWTTDLLRLAREDMDRRCATLMPDGGGPTIVSEDAFGQRRCYSRLWGGHDDFDRATTGSVLNAWCDGSGISSDASVGAGAVVHSASAHVTVERSHSCGRGTSNTAEIQAISLALATCTRLDLRVHLRADSEYALGVVFNRAWKPKKNVELVREAHALATLRQVQTEHVRGHSGDPGNERADELAGLARRVRP